MQQFEPRSRVTIKRRDLRAKTQGLLSPLYAAISIYFIVILIRPQDLIPAIGALRPGLLSFVAVAATWAFCKRKPHPLHDPVFRWQLVYLAVVVIGLVGVVNHRAWWYATTSYAEYLIAYSLALPAVMQDDSYRTKLLRLFAFSFLFLAIWVVAHHGVGTAAWMVDENDAAAVLIVGTCLGYALWKESAAGAWRRFGIALAAICVIGVVATKSRGGFLGLAAAFIAIAVFSGAFWRTAARALVIALLALPIVPTNYISEIRSIGDSEDRTRTERLYSWGRAWDMFLANPIIGVGAGNFPWQVNIYEQSAEAQAVRAGRRALGGRAAHSLPFTLISEMGGLGAIAFVAAVGLSFRRAWRVARAPRAAVRETSYRVLAAWLGTGMIGFLVAAVFISTLWYPMVWLMIGLGIVLGSVTTYAPAPNAPMRAGAEAAGRSIATGAADGNIRRV